MPSELSIAARILLVRAALERIKLVEQEWQAAESNPSSSSHERERLKERLMFTEREFAWQANNVKAILDHFAPEQP